MTLHMGPKAHSLMEHSLNPKEWLTWGSSGGQWGKQCCDSAE